MQRLHHASTNNFTSAWMIHHFGYSNQHVMSLFFKPVFYHWTGGEATPTNRTGRQKDWSMQPSKGARSYSPLPLFPCLSSAVANALWELPWRNNVTMRYLRSYFRKCLCARTAYHLALSFIDNWRSRSRIVSLSFNGVACSARLMVPRFCQQKFNQWVSWTNNRTIEMLKSGHYKMGLAKTRTIFRIGSLISKSGWPTMESKAAQTAFGPARADGWASIHLTTLSPSLCCE